VQPLPNSQTRSHAVDSVLAAYRAEGCKVAAAARAVELVERALRASSLSQGLALAFHGGLVDDRRA
jgi:hypothetical protein